MIELKDLSVSYGSSPVVRNVSLSFPAGTVTVLLGPNGSGKSTLLKAAMGLLPAGKEQVLYDGTPLEKLSRRQTARMVSLLAQNRPSAAIEARRLVLHGRFPYLSYPRHYSSEDHRIAREAMEQTGAWAYADRIVSELSGGQRQSVYLAMLLAQQTPTVFLDEPTTFLDIRHQLDLMDWVRKLADAGKAVVLILHDLPMALETADRLAVLENGQLRMSGTPEEVYASGILEEVFRIRLHRLEAPDGIHYFCTRQTTGV